MKTIKEIEEIWNKIPMDQEGFLELDIESPISFHIGIDSYGNKCFLFIYEKEIQIPNSSKKIIISNIKISDNKYAITFSLIENELQDIFLKICWDIISYTAKQSKDLINAIINRYLSWVKLLEKEDSKRITLARQKGLLGELYFLNKKIDSVGDVTSINSWMGPEKADQDFIFEDEWFEIKTIGKSKTKVSISSIEQLDQENKGYLVVYFCDKTSSEDSSGISLSQMIENINSKINSELIRNIFEIKLLKFDLSLNEYKNYKDKFRISNENIYLIDSTFPKIVKQILPKCICSVKYSLILSEIEKYCIKG